MTRTVVSVVMLCILAATVIAEDPYVYYTWNVSYGTISPLGVPQQAILINNQFPGPEINGSSNNNIVVNVFNNIDEPLLFTWHGIQLRKNSWQDGTPGTMCPIQPGTNFTYKFQVKDQIGSYFYFPTIGLQRVAGGVGGLRVFSRLLIPVPYQILRMSIGSSSVTDTPRATRLSKASLTAAAPSEGPMALSSTAKPPRATDPTNPCTQ
ncbi:L-ascorbate oxidase homolog [Arachis ipaensis]|uniref:L-ascorbate oxidase homolog n=1 Tax=Arachis ipaensis TaxID=130454 RepID=UPI000A2B45D7|nr:L-ascorbate oxidase homolog [Arachis ipaensis]